jgi:hypothetical protein
LPLCNNKVAGLYIFGAFERNQFAVTDADAGELNAEAFCNFGARRRLEGK